MTDPIYVKGWRCKANAEFEDTADGGGIATFVPQFVHNVNWQEGLGGGATSQRVQLFTSGDNVIFKFDDIGIDVRIPQADWNAMSEQQRRILTYIFQHYTDSERLTAALTHLATEGASEVIIRYGPTGTRFDGTSYPFIVHSNGSSPVAAVSADSNPSDHTGTDLKPGSPVVISINSAHSAVSIADIFAEAIIHEILHPWVPDTPVSGGYDDHALVDVFAREELAKIFRFVAPADLPPGAEAGIAFLGSHESDHESGTTANDIMAGMEGDDVLNGLGGDDVLLGGPGMDTLIAGSGSSDLRGGTDADTYVAAVVDANFFVEDSSGVDRIVIAGSSQDFIVTREGDDLCIWSSSEGWAYQIVNHYLESHRIEIFQFADAEYSASYIEYLASTTGGPGVCYQDGYPIICGQYGMPVVIDLDGDGVELVDANKTHVRWDVDGDGKAERTGWTNGDDAFLVLDRNGNGRIDSFSELSFLSDFRGAGSDLEGLLAYDTDGDGFLTASDAIFSRLQLWRDANLDGVSQPGELVSLTDAGVRSISLEIMGLKKLDQSLSTNQVLGHSDVAMRDGSHLAAYDVGLVFKSRDDDWHPNHFVHSEAANPHAMLAAEPVI